MKSLLAIWLLASSSLLSNGAPSNEKAQRLLQFAENKKLVDEINAKATSFEAYHYPQFESHSPEELGRMAGGRIEPEHLESKARIVSGEGKKTIRNSKLPKKFNVWDKWPECMGTFLTIHNQGFCGSCYAVSTASALTDRRCIASGGLETEQLSSWDIVSCCPFCAEYNPKKDNLDGCFAGYPIRALNWFNTAGIVTGGDYKSNVGCKPYPNSPNTTTWDTTCQRQCQPNYSKQYAGDKRRGESYWRLYENVTGVMEDIYMNGPVTAVFDLYEDFNWYRQGIYKHTQGRKLGGHVVRVMGWGETPSGTLYWKVANSYGPNWGENGFVRFLRGSNHLYFEDWMMGGGVGSGRE